jgi:SAM-dependent methyltransferase
MPGSDEGNLIFAHSTESVDQINGRFYGRFPYPQRAFNFDYLEDTTFEPAMLCQGLGDWGHRRVPPGPRVWVAGCGTNQAVFTALRFRGGSVLGSDLSSASLEVSAGTSSALGLSNLEVRQESINGVGYREEFDYIISTGVIHHNADPRETLLKLAGALKPGGVLELMVYNKFHWTIPAAFQNAVRLFGADAGPPDFELELALTRRLIAELPPESSIGSVAMYRDISEAMLADELMQPVLHHYTVGSCLGERLPACARARLLRRR